MVYVVLITFMLAIEIFYFTQLRSFLECFFGYLHFLIPIVLSYILERV